MQAQKEVPGAAASQAPRRLPALQAGLRVLALEQMVNYPISTPESFTVVWCVIGAKGFFIIISGNLSSHHVKQLSWSHFTDEDMEVQR